MKKGILTIIVLVGFQIIGFGQAKMDTITNWQFYKDAELLVESNILDGDGNLAIVNVEDDYESLVFQIYYDFYSDSLNRKIEFIYNNQVIVALTDRNLGYQKFNLEKCILEKSIKNYLNKKLLVKYSDKFHPDGLIVSELKFVKTQYDVLQIKEIKEVIRLAIDLPSLQQYFHIQELPERIPLVIKEFGLINSKHFEGMMKFEEPIQFKTEAALNRLGIENYLGIGDWTPVNGELRLQLYYPIEGITINYMFKKESGKWEIIDSLIMEN